MAAGPPPSPEERTDRQTVDEPQAGGARPGGLTSEPSPAAEPPPEATEPGNEATELQNVIWPWVAKRTRTQVVALVVISCLALGPIAALVIVTRADPTPVHQLVEPLPPAPDVTRVTATALGLSPSAGELRMRILIDPADDISDESGRLEEPIAVVINDVRGATERVYEAGDSPGPFEIALPVSAGTTTRYPFDQYRGSLFVVVREASGASAERFLVAIGARSVIEEFVLSASVAGEATGPQEVTVLDWTAGRPGTTTVYAVWLMILMWGLAVIGLLIVWAVVMWMVDIPFWLFGYFVGVLFALPPLRDSLPGRPPPGTLFDYGSFYWSVTISGVNLIVVLAIWLRRTHAKERLRSLDPSRPD